MTSRDHQRSASWHFCFWGVILSSFVIPFIILAAAVALANLNKPLGAPSDRFRIYQGAIKNGELWFPEIIRSNSSDTEFECRLKRLHLADKLEYDSGISVRNEFLAPFWTAGGFCAATPKTVYRIDDGRLIEVCPMPPRSKTFYCNLFLLNGEWTSIRECEEGGYRLIHFVDNEWADGRKIRLPGFDYLWRIDDQGRQVFSRRSQAQRSLIPQSAFIVVSVVEHRDQLYVFHADHSQMSYRVGFEFDDSPDPDPKDGEKSTELDVTPWKPLFRPDTMQSHQHIAQDVDGLIAAGATFPNLIQGIGARWVIQVLRDGDQWQEIKGLEELKSVTSIFVVGDHFGRNSLVISENQRWSAAVFHRIENDTLQPAFYATRGDMPTYLARWSLVGLGAILAWISHILIPIFGLYALNGRKPLRYAFGNQVVSLATPYERFKAGLVNVMTAGVVLIPLILVQAVMLNGLSWKPLTELEMCNALFDLERGIIKGAVDETVVTNLAAFVTMIAARQKTMVPLYISEVITAFVLWVAIQYYFGRTPGEWWTKVRIVRMDLRKRRLGEIIIRTGFYWLDVPFFVTLLPAFVSMAWSDRMQRWGDRVSQTIVIRSSRSAEGSIPNDLSSAMPTNEKGPSFQ